LRLVFFLGTVSTASILVVDAPPPANRFRFA